jgi:hypothetical protein
VAEPNRGACPDDPPRASLDNEVATLRQEVAELRGFSRAAMPNTERRMQQRELELRFCEDGDA